MCSKRSIGGSVTLRNGRFVTLEGIDGAGKSTHIAWLADRIRARGHAVVATREPGGTPVGEALRRLLLHERMTHDTEALLMFASRREHLEQVIRPALGRGEWVLCDRFSDATFAYQGGGHGVPLERIAQLEAWIHGGLQPDRTLLFDVAPTVSRERLLRSTKAAQPDKFECESATFFERVRAAYLERARCDPARFRVVDSSRPMAEVQRILEGHVGELESEGASS